MIGAYDSTSYKKDDTDKTGIDPMLGALEHHGGTMASYSLQAGSPAIDMIPAADSFNEAPVRDGRDYYRADGDGDDAVGYDCGAYEYKGQASLVETTAVSSVTISGAVSGGDIAYTGATVGTRGVCWSTSADPTTSASCTEDGSGMGSFSSSLTDLSPETKYYVRAYAMVDGAATYGGNETFTTAQENDGIEDSVEDGVSSPDGSTGDGNGDGEDDRNQADVASLKTYTDGSEYATLDVTSKAGVSLESVKAVDPKTTDAPSTVSFPYGLFSFKIVDLPAKGASVTMSIFVKRDTSISGYYKKNMRTGEWENIADAIDHTSVSGKTKITFTLADGGDYDEDGLANQEIDDDSGPVSNAGGSGAAVPAAQPWHLVLLALLLGGLGVLLACRRGR